MEHIIEIDNISFAYEKDSESSGVNVLKDVILNIEKGSFLAVIGKNGSGKSTMAKHINALLLPGKGRVIVKGYDTSHEECLWDIRQTAGMVFQNHYEIGRASCRERV